MARAKAVDIRLGDCLEVMPTLADASVDAVVTDPPYMLGAASARRSADKAIGWADVNNASRWYADWMGSAWRVLRETGSLWVFANWRSFPVLQCAASKIPGMAVLSVVVWDKQWPSVGSMRGLRQNYELIVLFGKPGFAINDRSLGDIWPCKWASSKPSGHPQEKPVALAARIIASCELSAGSVILDPFCGSGSFGVAAIDSGCQFVGIEIEAGHFAIAQQRIAAARRKAAS